MPQTWDVDAKRKEVTARHQEMYNKNTSACTEELTEGIGHRNSPKDEPYKMRSPEERKAELDEGDKRVQAILKKYKWREKWEAKKERIARGEEKEMPPKDQYVHARPHTQET